MTYSSRGRSIVELILAAIFIGFLTGFVAVLCFGNYYRAKQAMERQRQRRLARFAHAGGGATDSPKSHFSSNTAGSTGTTGESTTGVPVDETQHLLTKPSELPRRRNNEGPEGNVDRRQQFNIVRV